MLVDHHIALHEASIDSPIGGEQVESRGRYISTTNNEHASAKN